MAIILENTLQAEIDAVSAHAHRLYNAGDLQSYLEFHERAWSMYPEPRNNWNEAYIRQNMLLMIVLAH